MISSTSSNLNDPFQIGSNESTVNPEIIDDEPSSISHTNYEVQNSDDNGFQCIVEALSERIEKLEADNRELVERQTQGPTCGVCMDNRVCIYIFLLIFLMLLQKLLLNFFNNIKNKMFQTNLKRLFLKYVSLLVF